MWEYRVELERVVDGDTMDFTVDLGFKTYKKVRVRLSGVDTHETYGVDHDSKEYELGVRETEFAREWLERADELFIETENTGKYGRWLAHVYNESGESLNVALIEEFDDVRND